MIQVLVADLIDKQLDKVMSCELYQRDRFIQPVKVQPIQVNFIGTIMLNIPKGLEVRNKSKLIFNSKAT